MKLDPEKYLERLLGIEDATHSDIVIERGMDPATVQAYAQVVTAICAVLREIREGRSQSDQETAKRQRDAAGGPR